MASDAIEDATHVDDIEFPEFTAKLITDTFKALIDANITQMEAYAELVKTVATSLSTYINDTKDYISAETIINFLSEKLPAPRNDAAHDSSIYQGKTLTEKDASELNGLMKFDSDAGITPTTYEAGDTLTGSAWTTLVEECAKLITQNKYKLLKEMVNQGMLRLVVESGVIETRLHFYARSQKHTYDHSTDYHRDTERKVSKKRGGIFSAFTGGTTSRTVTTNVNVSTGRSGQTTYDSTSVSLYGAVKLNFKTDYLKLSE